MRKPVKILTVLTLALAAAFSFALFAACDGASLRFRLMDDGAAYEVVGCVGDARTVTIPAYYKEKPVTAIGDYAFTKRELVPDAVLYTGKKNLTDVVFEDGSPLTRIGNGAFAGCEKLWGIDLPDGVTAIGDNAFLRTALETVTIPAGVTELNGTFEDCQRLTAVTFAAGSRLETIGRAAFSTCVSLQEVTIPDGVKKIEGAAFYGCNLLKTIGIPAFVTEIELRPALSFNGPNGYPFAGCAGLTSVTVADGNTAYRVDGNCLIETATNLLIKGFQDSVIPDGITGIFCEAFNGCSALTEIVIPESVTRIEDGAFFGTGIASKTPQNAVIYAGNWAVGFKRSGSAPVSVVLKSDTRGIGDSAFNRSRITDVAIPDSVASIGENAFAYCPLTDVTIPANVVSIGENAFNHCQGLTRIKIPASVAHVGAFAFYGCDNLSIDAEARRQPAAWSKEWNYDALPVAWGCTDGVGYHATLYDDGLPWLFERIYRGMDEMPLGEYQGIIIKNQAQFNETFQEFPPGIDFDEEMIVIHFFVNSFHGGDFDIKTITEKNDTVTIAFGLNTPDAVSGGALQLRCFVVKMVKLDASVRLEPAAAP